MLRRVIALLVLLLPRAALAQHLVVTSDEALVPPAVGPAPYKEDLPHVARGNGQVFLLYDDESYDIYGCIRGLLINDDGTVLRLPCVPSEASAPGTYNVAVDVAFDGQRYLVVYGHSAQQESDLCGYFVTPDGVMSPAFDIFHDDDMYTPPSIGPGGASLAYGGGTYFVTYVLHTADDANHIAAALVDPTGHVTSLPLLSRPSDSPTVASDGSGFLVAFNDNISDTVGIQRFDSTGTPIGDLSWPRLNAKTLVRDSQPTLAFSGDHYVLGFRGTTFMEMEMAWGPSTIYAMRIQSDGTVLDTPAIEVAQAGATSDASWPYVAADGKSAVLLWGDTQFALQCCGSTNHIRAARLNEGGQLLDPGGILVTAEDADAHSDGLAAIAGAGGTSGITVYYGASSGTDTDIDLYSRHLGPSFVPDPRVLVSTTETSQYWGHRTGNLLAFTDARSGRSQLYATRLDGDVALDSSGVDIDSDLLSRGPPAIAHAGASYLVVAEESGREGVGPPYGIHGAIVTTSSNGLVSSPVELVPPSATVAQSPVVATRGEDYLVVWYDGHGGPVRLYGTIISATGEVATPGGTALLDDQLTYGSLPALSATANGYVAAFRSLKSGKPELYALELDDKGVPLQAPIRVGTSSTYGDQAFAAFGDAVWMAWTDATDLVLTRFMGSPLTVVDERRIVTGGSIPTMAVLSDGTLLLAWETYVSATEWRVSGTAICPNSLEPLQPTLLTTVREPTGIAFASDASGELLYWAGDGRSPSLVRGMKLNPNCTQSSAADGGVADDDAGRASEPDAGDARADGGSAIEAGGGCGCHVVGRGGVDPNPILLCLWLLLPYLRRRALRNKAVIDVGP